MIRKRIVEKRLNNAEVCADIILNDRPINDFSSFKFIHSNLKKATKLSEKIEDDRSIMFNAAKSQMEKKYGPNTENRKRILSNEHQSTTDNIFKRGFVGMVSIVTTIGVSLTSMYFFQDQIDKISKISTGLLIVGSALIFKSFYDFVRPFVSNYCHTDKFDKKMNKLLSETE